MTVGLDVKEWHTKTSERFHRSQKGEEGDKDIVLTRVYVNRSLISSSTAIFYV